MNASLEQRALEAARTVAIAHGLAADGAVVIHSGSNVLVHLRPAPVIARVMTGTVVLHAEPRQWLEREVSVLEFLAPSGLAVAPSRLIAPGPYRHDGLWMTFTEWLSHVPRRHQLVDAGRFGRVLRSLHDALQTFDGALGTLADLGEDIERLRGLLRPNPALDVGGLSALRARLDAVDDVFRCALPTQALHGDVSLSNLLQTPEGGLVWNDFEDTFRGPVHWDLAGYVMSLRARGAAPAFVARVLDHYGWGDAAELEPFMAAHRVYDAIWQHYDLQRRQDPGGGTAPSD